MTAVAPGERDPFLENAKCVNQSEKVLLLQMFNTASDDFLRTTVGLRQTIVDAIKAARPISDLAVVSAISFFGVTEAGKSLAYARSAHKLDNQGQAEPGTAEAAPKP